MEEKIDVFLIGLVGLALIWMVAKCLRQKIAPEGTRWGNWNLTYNAPPPDRSSQKVYMYPYAKFADFET